MGIVQIPPQQDFDGYTGLLDLQRNHLGDLAGYAGAHCTNIHGLDNALSFLREPLSKLGEFTHNRLVHCETGIGTTSAKVRAARDGYARADAAADAEIRNSYPGLIPGFVEIPGGPSLGGDFDDFGLRLEEPQDADDALKADLHRTVSTLGTFEKVWQWATGGDSLLERLVRPITGNYGRLKYLYETYDRLGESSYTVAGNLRRGTLKIATEWNGDGATAFESYMFRWHMGIGGLGDLDKLAADALRKGYDTIATAVWAYLSAVGALIDLGLKRLVDWVVKTLLIDAAVIAAGGGPEDPVADLIALGITISRLWDLYKNIQRCVALISIVVAAIKVVREKVEQLRHGLHEVVSFMDLSRSEQAKVAVDFGLQKIVGIEGQQYWDRRAGAARIALLPAT